MALHGLPAPQALQHARVPRGAWHRVDRRHIVRAVVAEPPAADEVVQLSSKVTKDLRGERRKFNFAAGPGCLPKSVLETAQEDLLNYNGAGVSVMEMSHRSKEFIDICDRAEKDLRELLGIPDEYEVLFLQGGASSQFAAVPLNLTAEGDTVDHIVTGAWSKKAAEEAGKFCNVNIVAKGDNKLVPPRSAWNLSPNATYVHYCDNETIQGVEFKGVPDVDGALLVADMSSNFCSKPVDVTQYGLIYAGAQKNVGPAGLTIVIARKDLLDRARPNVPTMLHYKTLLGSMYNTPPCWSIYMAGLVFAKLLKEGGLDAVRERNEAKAKIVYDAIANSAGFYHSPVDAAVRSLMNIPFTIPSKPELEKIFVSEAAARGLGPSTGSNGVSAVDECLMGATAEQMELKGHRSVGGMRASVYNAMPPEGAQALATFMKEFASEHA